jgi:hypothetical protein
MSGASSSFASLGAKVDERQRHRRRPDVSGADIAQLRQRAQQPQRRLRKAAVRACGDGGVEAPPDVGRRLLPRTPLSHAQVAFGCPLSLAPFLAPFGFL